MYVGIQSNCKIVIDPMVVCQGSPPPHRSEKPWRANRMPDIPLHVTAVVSALQFRGGSQDGLRNLTSAEWEDLFSRPEINRLMNPLRRICGEYIPEWVQSRIDMNLMDNAERLDRIKEVYVSFADSMRESGAEHLVVKGFTQWPGFVDHPRLRLQSDIDIYCPPESISVALNALATLGYEPLTGLGFSAADHLPVMIKKTSWIWRGNYYDPQIPVSFEVHFCFWNESRTRIRPKGLEQFWLRRVERQLDDITFISLNAADNFGYAALNLLRNTLYDNASPYQLYEVARFLHTSADDTQFWKEWRKTHDDSLRRLEAVSCRLASQCFACRLPEEVEREIDCLPSAAKAWFDTLAALPLSRQYQRKDGIWLHISFLNSSSDKRSVIGRILPTRVATMECVDRRIAAANGQTDKRPLLQRCVGYATYLISRSSFNLYTLPANLWRGARFWLATRFRRS